MVSKRKDTNIPIIRDWRGHCFSEDNFSHNSNLFSEQLESIYVAILECDASGAVRLHGECLDLFKSKSDISQIVLQAELSVGKLGSDEETFNSQH